MSSAKIEDVQAHLTEIVEELNPGELLVITRNGEPVASLARNHLKQWPCTAGSAKVKVHWMASDFDAPLEEFKEYME